MARSIRSLKGARLVALPLVAALVLIGCGNPASDEHEVDEPVRVEYPEGTDVARLTLTSHAAARIDIQTTSVEEAKNGTVVPSAAVFVDPQGIFWLYTSPQSLVFVRQRIEIIKEADGWAFLSNGPPVGTTVVTVGVPELYGAEYGVGH